MKNHKIPSHDNNVSIVVECEATKEKAVVSIKKLESGFNPFNKHGYAKKGYEYPSVDERLIIAKEVSVMLQKIHKQIGTDDYSLYVAMGILGSFLRKSDTELFEQTVSEIRQNSGKKVA